MFSAAMALTILGGALTVGGTVWALTSALKARKYLASRLDEATGGEPFDPAESFTAVIEGNTKRSDEIRAAIDRRVTALGEDAMEMEDIDAMRLHIRWAIAEDQIKSFRGPALIILVGVVASTAGSILSLYV
jgi:hypothetical protein